MAIFITVATQEDMETALHLLFEGYNNDVERVFPEAGVTAAKWTTTVFLRFGVGCFGLVVTFILIIISSDVVELLLNFTAVEFVSLLGKLKGSS